MVYIPKFLVMIRRHWMASVGMAVWLLPIITLVFFHQSNWAVTWLIVWPIIALFLFVWIVDSLEKEENLSELILKAKINYSSYNTKLGSPLYAFMASTKTIISLLAAIATIISAAVLFIGN